MATKIVGMVIVTTTGTITTTTMTTEDVMGTGATRAAIATRSVTVATTAVETMPSC